MAPVQLAEARENRVASGLEAAGRTERSFGETVDSRRFSESNPGVWLSCCEVERRGVDG